MVFIFGLIVLFGSVISGYTMHGGSLLVLYQPTEYLIIVGAAVASVIIGYPAASLKKAIKGSKLLFTGNPVSKQDYMDLLLFSFNVFKLMKIKGMLEIEKHVEQPEESEIFQQSVSLKKDPFMYSFVCDNLRILTMGVESPHEFEDIVSNEIELYSKNAATPGDVYTSLGDSLPAIGIVAAVLGVIITMRSIMEPPDVLGALIGAALVGTFLGVFLAYGIASPIGHVLHKYGTYKVNYIECAKIGFVSYLNDHPPVIIVEFMRKNIPDHIRPSFAELDTYINENAMKV